MSDSMKFRCENCRQKLSVERSWAGKTINCPGCAGKLTIPSSDKGPAPASTSEGNEQKFVVRILALEKALSEKTRQIAELQEELTDVRDRARKSLAMPMMNASSTRNGVGGVTRQNTALQRRVDALNMELDEKNLALASAGRRNRELQDEIKFVRESGTLQESARTSISSFIENVERNQSVDVGEQVEASLNGK